MKDFATDDGTPHNQAFIFNSPDIWLSSTPGGSAINNGVHVGNVTPHYLNVRVHNSTSSTNSGLLKVYWAKAGIAQTWINDWNNALVSSTAVPTGSVPAGDMVAHPVFISVPSNTHAVFSVPWVVPNPAWYADATPNDAFHFCVVATIETGCNTLPNSTYLAANVQQSNKFSWKNFSVLIDYFLPKLNPVPAGNIHLDHGSTFKVVANSHENVIGEVLQEYADVSLVLTEPFREIWENGGFAGTGISALNNKISFNHPWAEIDNLYFEDGRKELSYFIVHFKKQAPLENEFYIDLMEYELLAGKDSLVGGIQYRVVPPICPQVKVAADTVVIDPACVAYLSAFEPDTEVDFGWYNTTDSLVSANYFATVSPGGSGYFILKGTQNGCTISDSTYIVVTAESGCLARSSRPATEDSLAAALSKLHIYPNPASKQTTVEYELSGATDGVIVVTNTFGQIVYNKDLTALSSELSLNCTTFSPGLYIVSLYTGKTIQAAVKLIIAD